MMRGIVAAVVLVAAVAVAVVLASSGAFSGPTPSPTPVSSPSSPPPRTPSAPPPATPPTARPSATPIDTSVVAEGQVVPLLYSVLFAMTVLVVVGTSIVAIIVRQIERNSRPFGRAEIEAPAAARVNARPPLR